MAISMKDWMYHEEKNITNYANGAHDGAHCHFCTNRDSLFHRSIDVTNLRGLPCGIPSRSLLRRGLRSDISPARRGRRSRFCGLARLVRRGGRPHGRLSCRIYNTRTFLRILFKKRIISCVFTPNWSIFLPFSRNFMVFI